MSDTNEKETSRRGKGTTPEELRQLNGDLASLFAGDADGGKGAAAGTTPGTDGSDADRRILRQREAQRGEKSGPPKVRRRGLRVLLVLLVILAVLGGGAVGSFFYLRESGRRSLLAHENPEGVEIAAPEDAVVAEGGRRVTYQGRTYELNEDVISILCLGTDRDEETAQKADQLKAGQQGQADTIFVAALNIRTGEITMINISRDSMVDVDVYDVEGNLAGVEEMQICLAYAYGDGKRTSCENTAKSVSRLLYGIPMDAYGSIEMPAIGVLNDAVGGVTVTVLEDLSSGDSAMTKGAKITLSGDQARYYVRTRKHDSADANNARMQRQRQYLTAFVRKVLSAARSNLSIVLSLYQAARTYMTTDVDLSRMVYLASLVMTHDFTTQNIVTVPGEATMGEALAEYRVDDRALYDIILDVYYEEVGGSGESEKVSDEEAWAKQNLVPEEEIETEQAVVTVDPKVLH